MIKQAHRRAAKEIDQGKYNKQKQQLKDSYGVTMTLQLKYLICLLEAIISLVSYNLEYSLSDPYIHILLAKKIVKRKEQ